MAKNRSSYNYSGAFDHKATYFIPMTEIPIPGILFAIGSVLVFALLVFIFYVIADIFFRQFIAGIVAVALALVVVFLFITYAQERNKEQGTSIVGSYWYRFNFRYKKIVTNEGKVYYLVLRKKDTTRFF